MEEKAIFYTSEDELLHTISKYFPQGPQQEFPMGRGDDCALLAAGETNVAISTDLFIEDVHFRREYFAADEIGYKSLACNISDLAACGVRPAAFTMTVAVPNGLTKAWFNDFLSGMGFLAAKYNMSLIGGDISRSDKLAVSITVFGRETRTGSFLVRGGSVPGDMIFVVGELGLARVGLCALEEEGREAALAAWPKACLAHLKPEPQVDAGLMLARIGFNTRPPALMDLSDGLIRDLPRLLGSSGEFEEPDLNKRLGAELIIPAANLHQEVLLWARKHGRNPVHEVLLGGEDYALLGSCAPDLLPSLYAAIPGFKAIGTVTDTGKIYCNREHVDGLIGFDHFNRS